MEGCPSAAAACTDVRYTKLILRAGYGALHSIRQEAFRRRRASDTASKKICRALSACQEVGRQKYREQLEL